MSRDVPKPMTFGEWKRVPLDPPLPELRDLPESKRIAMWAVEIFERCWHAATEAERERCLDWVMAYSRDCGCADLIAAAIRAGGKEPKP